MKVTVRTEDVEAILGKFEKLGRKALKLGLPAPVLTVGEKRPVFFKKAIHDGLPPVLEGVYQDLVLEGEGPKLNGWRMGARLDWLDEKAVLMGVPGLELKRDWKTAANLCEHCGTTRRRLTTFVVVNEAGEEKQVGGDCLTDFLGHNAAAIFGFYCEEIAALEFEIARDGGPRSKYLSTELFLDCAAAVIRKYGWKSRTEANGDGSSSADRADYLYFDLAKGLKKHGAELDSEALALSSAALAWARGELKEKPSKGDYEHNLVAVLENDYLHPKHTGIAASVIVAYQKALAKAAEKENEGKSEFQGEVGKRTVFKGLTLVFEKQLPGQFGTTSLMKFKDAAGNVFVWFASGIPVIGYEKRAIVEGGAEAEYPKFFQVGESYDLKATVKAHEVYGDVKQTLLSRAAVDVPKEPKKSKVKVG